mgnify:CR=1 FL=1
MAKLKSDSIANLIELKPKLRPDKVITLGRRTLKSSFFINYFKAAKIDSPATTLSPTLHFSSTSNGI